jgi:aminoglycoside phosphotransferase (APT) family kinase protein
MAEEIEGIDVAGVTKWFEANIAGVKPPLDFDLIAGGRSNLTFKVTDSAGQQYVLRRPPKSHVLATAHDMSREFKIISALAPTPVPVAPALGFTDDEGVNGAPFYVMDYVDGLIVRDAKAAERITPETRRVVGESLIDVLAEIHAVDPDAVGLGDLGRKDGYIERQLKRWYQQFQQSKMREVPLMDEMYEFLKARIPEQGRATIVHGDYRLDNTMLDPATGNVMAVLDWEICTLGDPLADIGLLMVYWTDRDDVASGVGVGGGATTLEGFPRKAELRARYADRTGVDVEELDFYIAFGYWKLAAILDGVATRYAKGAMGRDGAVYEGFAASVVRLAETSHRFAEALR